MCCPLDKWWWCCTQFQLHPRHLPPPPCGRFVSCWHTCDFMNCWCMSGDVLLCVKDDEERMLTDAKRPRRFTEPLHVSTTSCQGNGSLSPTRVGKQCFSPSLQQPIKNSAFTPSPTPSPTRKTVCARWSALLWQFSVESQYMCLL